MRAILGNRFYDCDANISNAFVVTSFFYINYTNTIILSLSLAPIHITIKYRILNINIKTLL